MTDDKIQALHDDIAFMRALAQEGSTTPLLFGGILVAAGATFGVGAVWHWLMVMKILPLPEPYFALVWLSVAAVFAVVSTVLIRRAKGRPGFSAGVNKATAAAWSGIGFAIFTIWMGMMAFGWVTGFWQIMAVFPMIIFALYGAAWFVAGAMSGKRWIKLVALGSFAGAVVVGALTTSPYQMLVYAAGLVLLAVVPGLILMRQEPTDVV